MLFFKKKDPICGMKERKGSGTLKHGKWFCSESCLNEYEKKLKKQTSPEKHSCCGHCK